MSAPRRNWTPTPDRKLRRDELYAAAWNEEGVTLLSNRPVVSHAEPASRNAAELESSCPFSQLARRSHTRCDRVLQAPSQTRRLPIVKDRASAGESIVRRRNQLSLRIASAGRGPLSAALVSVRAPMPLVDRRRLPAGCGTYRSR